MILVGLFKGGFGGSMGFVGVPLMALAMPPIKAAAILLPILVFMDVIALWSWRGVYDRTTLVQMLPASIVGIGIGWLTASLVTADMVRLLVGITAILFVGRGLYGNIAEMVRRWLRRQSAEIAPSPSRLTGR